MFGVNKRSTYNSLVATTSTTSSYTWDVEKRSLDWMISITAPHDSKTCQYQVQLFKSVYQCGTGKQKDQPPQPPLMAPQKKKNRDAFERHQRVGDGVGLGWGGRWVSPTFLHIDARPQSQDKSKPKGHCGLIKWTWREAFSCACATHGQQPR